YPDYFIPFIGVAKVLGSIAILVPSFKSIKEWAYAGLFFDLFAATYSIIKTAGISPSLTFMILPMIFLFVSYYLWHKRTSSVSPAA
ncbi:MAG TPA: DoxX family protein, partial [Pedobacter sp.]|nr:DoxX family protein [Pedobacter sp.]